jgi:hypothetical protein
MNGANQRDLDRWHASKDREEDAHWDDKPDKSEESDDYFKDGDYLRDLKWDQDHS